MGRGARIARGLAKAHDKLKSVFMEGECLRVLSGDQQSYISLADYDSGWYLDMKEYSDVVAGKKYKRLVVEDLGGCRLANLRAATAFRVGDLVFKVFSKPTFLGSLPSYEFKLYPTGERV